MSDTTVRIDLVYNLEQDSFEISSTCKDEMLGDIIGDFLCLQIGKGADEREPAELDTYRISLLLDLSDDSFLVKDDCGNDGLRDGILGHYLRRLATSEVG